MGGPVTYTDSKGNEWTITFEITYIFSDALTEYASGLDKASDAYSKLLLSDQNKALPEDIKTKANYKLGDNILRIDNSEFKGDIKGSTGQGVNGGAASYSSKFTAIIHETFHMLGFGDRYYGMPGNYAPDFLDDVVGGDMTGPKKIHDTHYVDLLTFLEANKSLEKTGITTTTYGYMALKLDISCSGDSACTKSQNEIDEAKKRKVKTGTEPPED